MRSNIEVLVLLSCLVLGVSVSRSACANEKPQPPKANQVPTLADIWQEVLNKQDEMAKLIVAKKLGEVEDPAFRIGYLVSQMPEKSSTSKPDKLARLKELVQEVQKLAGSLDTTGDSGDQAGTEANAKKLGEVLRSIRSLYPKGTLPNKPKQSSANAQPSDASQ